MAYKHGVYTSEVATSMVAPITGTAGLQVIVGTAPVNMLKDPAAAVNVPLLVSSYKEAVEAVGYLPDFANYTLCECISANFSVVGIAPMVLINVLDPAKHKIAITGGTVQVNDGVAVLEETGVLLEGLTVKSGSTTLTAGTDYTTTWNDDGTLNIVVLSTGAGKEATSLTVTGNKIDPSKVTAADIVGGVDSSTGKETGLEVVRQVYPKLSMTPGILLAPRFSKDATVAAALPGQDQEHQQRVRRGVRCGHRQQQHRRDQVHRRQDHQGGAGGERPQRLRSLAPLPRWATRCTAAAHWRRR